MDKTAATATGTVAAPAPERDAINSPYWDSLAQGALSFQRCDACGHAWLPPRSECPACLADTCHWEQAAGGARLVSWVVYHIAYHPAFKDRLPYNVAVVELEEGPRLISNLVGVSDTAALTIDQRLRLVIEDEGGTAVPRFAPA
jgi:uncharacterized OB-fold protein